MLRRIFHCVKVETNSNYLKRSMLKHTNRYCHKPTQNNITRTHTDTQQPKIMSHQSKIISFEKKNFRQIVDKRLTLEISNDWNYPKMLLNPLRTTCGVYSTSKNYVQRLPPQTEFAQHCMGARIRKATASTGCNWH